MEVPQAINLRQLSEQERRTNILLQELGRPTVDPNNSYKNNVFHDEPRILLFCTKWQNSGFIVNSFIPKRK